jgi:hypothetical protein
VNGSCERGASIGWKSMTLDSAVVHVVPALSLFSFSWFSFVKWHQLLGCCLRDRE